MIKNRAIESKWWDDDAEIQKLIKFTDEHERILKNYLSQGVAPLKLARQNNRYCTKAITLVPSTLLTKEKFVRIIVGIEDNRFNIALKFDQKGHFKGPVFSRTTWLKLSLFSEADYQNKLIEVCDPFLSYDSVENACIELLNRHDTETDQSKTIFTKKHLLFSGIYFYGHSAYYPISDEFLKSCLAREIDIEFEFISEGFGDRKSELPQKDEWIADITVHSDKLSNSDIEKIGSERSINIWDNNYEENSIEPKGFWHVLLKKRNVATPMTYFSSLATKKNKFLATISPYLNGKDTRVTLSLSVKTSFLKPFRLLLSRQEISKYLEFKFEIINTSVSTQGVGDEIKWQINKSE